MALTYYRYDDASAPTLTGQVSSFITLLDACLVTGYGSKAAAGWTKPYTGANKAAFRMATGAGKNGHYVRVLDDGSVTDGAARTAALLGFTAMTTVDAGTGQFPLVPSQVSAGFVGLQFTKSDTLDAVARPWLVIADDTFFLVYCWQTKTTFISDTPVGRQSTFSFGQFTSVLSTDTGNTYINGRNNTVYNNTGTYGEATRQVGGGSFAADVRTFIAKSALGNIVSAQGCILNSSISGQAVAVVEGTNSFPNYLTGTLDYNPQLLGEKEPNGPGAFRRGTLPYQYSVNGTVPSVVSLTASLLRMFDTFAGTGVDAGKTFMVIPQYQTSTPYSLIIQIAGDR